MQNRDNFEISISNECYEKMVRHCLRKLNGMYLLEEYHEQQAYGLLGGSIERNKVVVDTVEPLYLNYRIAGNIKQDMDATIKKFAIPAKLPIEERAWVADPIETKNIINRLKKSGLTLIGTYHMHHSNSWIGLESKELPTTLDRVLASDTELFMFIVSIDEFQNSKIRAFYEGALETEAVIKTISMLNIKNRGECLCRY
ncbi:hypothetical protein [Propionispora vibrioides]|uniref:JAB domain-containing protein n=1 Tax=Propionispora vibrioides TaxID=112903 RepID=A0A1H8XD77_9FIRM|nr:hypothetical protein [Propionispora vibrioides]SEP37752.1 hypothetical protein SAMN04490178_12258 [Propionispora vibrioides]